MCALLDLRNGGQLAWEESGDPQGAPIFFLHGWPASRLQGAGFGPAASTLGLRIIAPDRPGIGLSTFQTGRRLLDWPPLVAELADHLGLARFRVLGVSGGGPYAVATAFALPARAEVTAVVSGAPPLPVGVSASAVLPVYRWLLALYRARPGLLRSAFDYARPFATLRPPRWIHPLLLRAVAPADAQALADLQVFEGSWECYREAWRGSALGVAADGEILADPWGFGPEEVQGCVRLWHGRDDRSFSVSLAEALARKMPRCTTRLVEGEGHYSLPIRHARAILKDLQETDPAKC